MLKLALFATIFSLSIVSSACNLQAPTKSSSKLASPIDSLHLEALFHGSIVASFDMNHPNLPTSDGRFPGGPAWFAPNIKALSLWRAAQLAAVNPDLLNDESTIFLHRYKLASKANIVDLSDIESKGFFDELEEIYGDELDQEMRRTTSLIDLHFKANPNIDGILINDSVSGMPELILKNPAASLTHMGKPETYEITPQYSCFSCKPKSYTIRGPDLSFQLIPDESCAPGFYIKRL